MGCNLSFKKLLNNITKIGRHKRLCHLYSIFNVSYCRFFVLKKTLSFTLFKIITVIKPSTFLRVGAINGGSGGTREGFHHSYSKYWTPPFCWISPSIKELSPLLFLHVSLCPFPDGRLHTGKSISNSFQTNITQNLASDVHFQCHNHDLLKTFLWN